ncbi:pentapeptide repeat-containing protein [Lactiplantibacillus carotarum]|uniref:pentapeptide repeat-containing protein n=1 Tax=Lactiplantibacillus carotarum TaxID=2993456 RepID=UPI00298F3DDE|nr:pentapeptide repeat-containing protein [Lactiplantibacillus carotarum]
MDQPRVLPEQLPTASFTTIYDDEDHLLTNVQVQHESVTNLTLPHPMLDHVVFTEVTFIGSVFDRLELTDAIFIKCDFSNCHFEKASFLRTRFVNCKMVGLDLTGTVLNNVQFDHCLLDLAMLCEMKLKTTDFITCRLTDASIMDDRLTKVRFNDCDLDKASFNQTALKNVNLSSCRFERLDLEPAMARGMLVNRDQAAMLAQYFNGVRVTD